MKSLTALGIIPNENDIRFVEDNWESPTLGAWGLGWEVWLNGMEITQFTYFQQVEHNYNPVSGEITYGLERIAMYLQRKETIYDIVWSDKNDKQLTYGDLYLQNEQEMSHFNFTYADVPSMTDRFSKVEHQIELIQVGLPIPAYEFILEASHIFNLLDARKAISVTERQNYILKIRKCHTMWLSYFLKSENNRTFR